MGFKTVNSLETDNVIALGGKDKSGKAHPTSIEGYYLGSREVPDKKKKSGVGYIHVFQTEKGNIGVWGKTDSDRKLKGVTPGTMTRVTHDGFRETPNGDMYVYKVEVDGDNTIEVAGLTQNEDNYQSSETFSDAADDSYEETPAPLLNAKSSSDRANAVKNLLARKK